MKYFLAFCLFVFATNSYAQTPDTFEVRFALRETTVNPTAATYLDNLVKKVLTPGKKIAMFGYADYRGTAGHNDSVATERVMNVQAYLLAKGVVKEDIVICEAKGKIERPGMTGEQGYAPDRKVLIIVQGTGTKLDIEKVQVNETVTLKNIFFEGNLPDIMLSSMPELQNLFNFMNEHKKVTIRIEGHACCKGMETGKDIAITDQKLSEMRAKAIYDYLAAKGISKNRMKYAGYGTTQPLVYPANTEDEQQQNRRVEIRILSK
ncbi:MAG: OmpA family protein [Flavipsychrobacter sp.]|jgi:outer membrane protein OmpA-like peptidoglycan-associated protein|nr:OmpA family protein [Flavipsychrobacter sp.]